ncbi:MAG: branched-chain amino acid ABC transporter permease [Lachnospiraceae bacterium]|jgi:branched-chain amino acid transport system permease protein|uniref:branched-chain amino acid ABC transporter permease n=1 Tax=Clostridium sp. (strain SY8519) TaxID=1042156 RepID=UPI0002171CBE|nr:branched-chain amino acid ABC transporter permease [Clostridium sp. SY8519]MCI1655143.1 branched-chain amino acid ABC transporter permease [Lachnospiraceae bacterium]MCI1657501.1 branched-chain amino acid ABC transporter permease [Lachnospiraceae bacterium]MCI2195916.1 branched-chain amino acid ABC transporter permease [Lachnospiraceae bacterium]BAK46530.1 branched-chain amino acid ABC-type transport system [Clostridium sp. SY8519]HAD19666.1 branched-chain amino acid ABC transporter permeas
MLQVIITGILLGGLYSMIGVGMSLVFGIMGLTNLAHGDLMILGTYITLVITRAAGLPLVLATIISVIVMCVLGFVIQQFLVNQVMDKGEAPALLVTFGLSIFLSNLMLKIFSADNQSINNALTSKNVITTEYLTVSASYLMAFIIACVIIIGLSLFMKYTNYGRAIRATSDDTMAAELMGVNTKLAFAVAMVICMGITAVAGTLVGSTFTFYPSSGTQYLIIAFGVVVIGGMGSLFGTLVGGIILGVAQLVGGHIFGSGVQMLVAYIVLLVILATRPNGLFAASAVRK